MILINILRHLYRHSRIFKKWHKKWHTRGASRNCNRTQTPWLRRPVRPQSLSSDRSVKKTSGGEQPRYRNYGQSSAGLCGVPIHDPVWCGADPRGLNQTMRPILANDVCITRSRGAEVGSKAKRPQRPKPNSGGSSNGRQCDNSDGDGALHRWCAMTPNALKRRHADQKHKRTRAHSPNRARSSALAPASC